MIAPISLMQLQSRFAGEIYGDVSACFSTVSTDSRVIDSGDLFIALQGYNFDGHHFIAQVLAFTPAAIVVDRNWADQNAEFLKQGNFWVVENTVAALAQVASLVRDAFNGPLIAITGSCGKTTVKEMLSSIASEAFGSEQVLATRGNFNNHIGVPKTLFDLQPEHKIAVIEMGASGPNEISHLVAIARPTVAVVNNVMAAHVEGFGSIDGVAKAKSAIYDGLDSSGVAVINIDDAYAQQFLDLNAQRRIITISLAQSDANLYAQNVNLQPNKTEFTLMHEQVGYPIELPATGLHNVRNALIATACALAAGMDIEAICCGLKNFASAKGRMNVSTPMASVTLIDDTYNANPGSVKAAIDALAAFEGQRWLVLGDMGELGADAELLHADIGDYAKKAELSGMVTVGPLSKFSAQSFGSQLAYETQTQVVTTLMELIKSQAGQINILIKGSRSARMELVVQAIADLKGKI